MFKTMIWIVLQSNYALDNWTIVKLLGGIAVIITSIVGLSFKYILARLTQSSQHSFDKDLEDIKGDISKNNSILGSLIQNYFSSSQKILDKKIQAYEMLWSCILSIKAAFPAGIFLVYQLLSDDEFQKSNAFETLKNNSKMNPLLSSYKMESEMMKIVEDGKKLNALKPFLSDNSFKLFSTYQGLIGRITHMFIWEYENKKLYDWKIDQNLDTILKITITNKEIDYIKKEITIGSLNSLIDLLEYKILQDIRDNLNIKETANDTIDYLKDVETFFKLARTKSA